MGGKVDHYIVVYRGQYEPYIAPASMSSFSVKSAMGEDSGSAW